jgi:hypothetical protein
MNHVLMRRRRKAAKGVTAPPFFGTPVVFLALWRRSPMTTLRFGHYALALSAAVLLASCAGVPTAIAIPGTAPENGRPAEITAYGASWMLPEAKSNDLLYVSALGDVYVFSYPEGNLEGTLTGFRTANGLCADRAGNVFVTNGSPPRILEYAHGRSKPINVLSDPHGNPYGCSVDATSGNLAVTNYCTVGKTYGCVGPGNVAVYRDARGAARIYKEPGYYPGLCSYDHAGNLFIEGSSSTRKGELVELISDSKTFRHITLSKTVTGLGVQWDGKYLAVGDGRNAIYRVSVSGSRGEIEGATILRRAGYHVYQFWIQGRTVIGPLNSAFGAATIKFWNYPAGGNPTKALNDFPPSVDPFGATVSLRG